MECLDLHQGDDTSASPEPPRWPPDTNTGESVYGRRQVECLDTVGVFPLSGPTNIYTNEQHEVLFPGSENAPFTSL